MWQEPAAALASPVFSLSARPSSDPTCKQAQGSCCAPSSCFAPCQQPLVLCCGALGARTSRAGSPWARHLRSIAPTPPGARVPGGACGASASQQEIGMRGDSLNTRWLLREANTIREGLRGLIRLHKALEM